jgi:hypothetical protein
MFAIIPKRIAGGIPSRLFSTRPPIGNLKRIEKLLANWQQVREVTPHLLCLQAGGSFTLYMMGHPMAPLLAIAMVPTAFATMEAVRRINSLAESLDKIREQKEAKEESSTSPKQRHIKQFSNFLSCTGTGFAGAGWAHVALSLPPGPYFYSAIGLTVVSYGVQKIGERAFKNSGKSV